MNGRSANCEHAVLDGLLEAVGWFDEDLFHEAPDADGMFRRLVTPSATTPPKPRGYEGRQKGDFLRPGVVAEQHRKWALWKPNPKLA